MFPTKCLVFNFFNLFGLKNWLILNPLQYQGVGPAKLAETERALILKDSLSHGKQPAHKFQSLAFGSDQRQSGGEVSNSLSSLKCYGNGIPCRWSPSASVGFPVACSSLRQRERENLEEKFKLRPAIRFELPFPYTQMLDSVVSVIR